MRDRSRNFQRKDEAGRCLQRPILDGTPRRATVEGRVHLHGIEALRIIAEIVSGSHALGIEGAVPAVGCKRRCSEADLSAHKEMLLWRNGQAQDPRGSEARA
jgi:hypothetical protein